MHKGKCTTYKESGVNIEAANEAVKSIKDIAEGTWGNGPLDGSIGAFAGMFSLNNTGASYKDPIILAGTDGVGTKLFVAEKLHKFDTIGIDLVAMCVNDVLAQGGDPLFFQDYIGVSSLDKRLVIDLVSGIAEGCKQACCSLLGGETAELPDVSHIELSGTAIGIAERSYIERVSGRDITDGDLIVGMPSSGFHSNGYSLIRRVATWGDVVTGYLKDEILKPTRIYIDEAMIAAEINKTCRCGVKAMAHITGGGLVENVSRVLHEGLEVRLDCGSWTVPEVFNELQSRGGIPKEEMWRVFNMGIGFVFVCSKDVADSLISQCDGKVIGHIALIV